jgi:hypothetical protein
MSCIPTPAQLVDERVNAYGKSCPVKRRGQKLNGKLRGKNWKTMAN